MLKTNKITVFGSILILLMTASCAKAHQNQTIQKSVPVKVVKIKKEIINERIFVTGDIKGLEEIYIYSFATGILRNKFVTEGQRVYPNQALFSINQTLRGSDYMDYIVRSPMDGILSEIQVDTGAQIVANTTIIAKVVRSNKLKAEIYISESEAGKIKLGNQAFITVEAAQQKVFNGKVGNISPIVNVNNRTIKIEIAIDEHNNQLRSGMFAEISIVTSQVQNAILVPQESVIYDDNETYVYKVDDAHKKVIKQLVTVSASYSGKTLIEKGLTDGELILFEGQYQVFEGYPVIILNNEVL